MTPEQRKRLEEMGRYLWPTKSIGDYMAGAQAAWEIRDAEIHTLKQALSFMEDCRSQEVAEAVKAERERIYKEVHDGLRRLSSMLRNAEGISEDIKIAEHDACLIASGYLKTIVLNPQDPRR